MELMAGMSIRLLSDDGGGSQYVDVDGKSMNLRDLVISEMTLPPKNELILGRAELAMHT